jgi:uncharacterized protein YigE (DUF2233 family)
VEWKSIHDGLRYGRFQYERATFHALRLDLSRVDLRIADARRASRETAEIGQLVSETKALAGVNGTFFDEATRPIGWLVSEGRQLNTLHETSWWSSLIVRETEGKPGAEIMLNDAVKALLVSSRSQVKFAIQVGPRTVADGAPLKLKNQVAERTAVCVIGPQDLVLIATEGKVESNALATIMARPLDQGGLGCRQGMMFDGGPSTQLAIRTEQMRLDVRGGWGVPDAVVVVPRVR